MTKVGSVLSTLDAEAAVRRVMVAYMAACDAHDADAVAELFHPDAVFVSLSSDTPPTHGREAVRADYAVACARLSFCAHYLTDERIEIDGDTARAQWAYLEPATVRHTTQMWTAGRYDHVLTRRDGVWKFAQFRIGAVLGAPYEGGWVPEHRVEVD
ncbi:MAG: nuclear transport factor 2 family protein [Actinomycetota bacterium]|nr:nuclear transport factor 2 family protein [Actinomycetota bacterium]